MGAVDSFDRTQRKHRVLGVPIGILYKYFDDQGNYLAAMISYYAFISIFPLLLLASSILGFILQGQPDLRDNVLNSALGQFPIIGDQLGRPEGLQGSSLAIVVGSVAALYGSLGLGQAIQNALNVAWSVPRNQRPNPVLLRVKSLMLMAVAGTSVLVITIVSTLGTNTEIFGPRVDTGLRWLIRLITVLLTGALLTVLLRLATARRHHLGRAAPGAFFIAFTWQALQYAGGVYVAHVILEASTMNKTFATILGLLALLYIAAVTGMLGIEVNVVLARRLWPRSLASLFIDNTDLTEADRRAYASYVRAQQHKSEENVDVSFRDPETGELRVVDEPGPKGHLGR
jgi:YihY family inner membrane protein